MSINSRFRLTAAILSTCAATAIATTLASAAAPKFYDDDPMWRAADTQDASSMKPLEVDLFVDLAANLLDKPDVGAPQRAGNVNSIDEVPDSSWFTNRVGRLS